MKIKINGEEYEVVNAYSCGPGEAPEVIKWIKPERNETTKSDRRGIPR